MADRSRKAELLQEMVKRVVDAADPVDMGAPLDEYDAEIALIAGGLNALASPSRADVEGVVFEVWNKQFGPLVENNEEAYRERLRVVAERLHAQLPSVDARRPGRRERARLRAPACLASGGSV